jgi:hypothetical protein
LGVHKFSTNPGPHINVLDDRRVTWSTLQIGDSHVLIITIKNLVAQMTCCLEFVIPAHSAHCNFAGI